ncbi:MAG TPA: urea amidolyase associated protein UAAP2 [Tepidisphaeraceae bacterium]
MTMPMQPEALIGKVILDEVIPSRAPWSGVVKRGQTLRIVDLEGNQSGDCILFNANNPEERYSAAQTMVAQKNIFLSLGTNLISNEGNVMMVVTADTLGRHDTIGGACSCESNTLRYGHHTKHQHACVENFIYQLGQHAMGKRDMTSNINWFMNVPVESDGTLGIVDGVGAPGKYVDLLAEMDTLVVISNCPQINNPCNGFNPTPLRMIVTEPRG